MKYLFIFYLYMFFFKYQLSHHLLVWCLFWGWIGVCIASFCGVVAYRLPKIAGWIDWGKDEKKISLSTPSHCENCGKKIDIFSLIPVLGWIINKGKCKHCHAKVPVQYPIIEFLTFVIMTSVAYFYGVHVITTWLLVLICWGLMVSWVDWKVLWIPDRFTVPVLFTALLYSPFETNLHSRVVAFILGISIFALISWIVSKRKGQNLMSGGDMMLIGAGGALVGMQHLCLFMGLSSVIFCIQYLLCKLVGFQWKTNIEELKEMIGESSILPMGPALIFGLIITLLYISWGVVHT